MFKFQSLILYLLCLAFCAGSSQALTLPVMVGQTGASSTFGKGEMDAYTLAIEEWNARGGINGQKISLEVEDTQTSPSAIVTAFHKIALAKPSVVLGPTWLDGFQAIIPLARSKQILLVTPSAAIEAFSKENADWPISFYHNSTLETELLAEALRERKLGKIAVIYEQEPFAEMIRQLLLKNSLDVVSDIGVQTGESDFRAIISRLQKESPQALVILVWNERSLLSLFQQLASQAPKLKLATVHDGEGWTKSATFKPVISQLLHTKFVIVDQNFARRFEERFGYEPMLTASNAYDAINAVLNAYQNGAADSAQIRKYISTAELDTATFGRVRFRQDGRIQSKIAIVEYKANLG